MSTSTAEKPTPAILPVYLREMSATRLLEREEEVRLSCEFREARAGLAAVADEVPAALRADLLGPEGAEATHGWTWPVREIDEFCLRLYRAAAQSRSAALRRLAARARPLELAMARSRDALITANLRLVVHVAKRYLDRGVPLLDLVQEGNLGLMHAIEKFDERLGNKLSTYAYWWIKQSIDRALTDRERSIRVPAHLKDKQRHLQTAVVRLRQTLRRDPEPEELAEALDLTPERVRSILEANVEIGSLDDDGAGGMAEVAEAVEDHDTVSPFDNARHEETRSRVDRALSRLAPREANIIRMRFGIGGGKACTLDEIGHNLHLSRERVRQLQARALKKLRASDLMALAG